MGRIFGTDGVRGLANRDLTAELALDLSVAAAHVLGDVGAFEGHRPTAVVGRDPRASGEFLSAAVVAGLASAGVDVLDVGVLPTPAVAFLTAALGADLGAVISASHNPMPDNGLKFLARGGHKLADELEDAIEGRLREPWQRPTGAAVGRVRQDTTAGDRYVEHLLSTLPHRLDGLTVVVDAAHGAAYQVAPEVLRRAGAEVIVDRRPAGRAEHQRRLRLRPTSTGCVPRCVSTAPTPVSPWTATPTAAWRWTRRARSSTATRSLPCSPWRCARPAGSRTTRPS